MKRRPSTLNAWFRDRRAGAFARAADGGLSFRYDAGWLARPDRFPLSLSLPLGPAAFTGAAVSNVLENLLPDEPDTRRRIASNLGAAGAGEFDLLLELGADCVGAFAFLPEGAEPGKGPAEGAALSAEEVGAMLANLPEAPLGLRKDSDFRISMAGAQRKTALLKMGGAWMRPRGPTPATHLLKPPLGRLWSGGPDLHDSVPNEHYCMTLAAALGLRTARTEIARFGGAEAEATRLGGAEAPVMESFGGAEALVVERFDRQWDGDRLLRLPQEDLCQALGLPPSKKYENQGGPGMRQILELLGGADRSLQDQVAFLEAQVLFWLIAATDGHAKNFSVQFAPGGAYRLAPLYDVMSVQPYHDRKQVARKDFKLAMKVGDEDRIDRIFPRHFLREWESARLSAASARDALHRLADELPAALDRALSLMPADFPTEIHDSISRAALERREDLSADLNALMN